MTDFIVCAFYTPDYEAFADALRRNLDQIGAPHDLHAVPKRDGGWEANTRAKPVEILAAMNRHPGKVILWLDVDCVVRGPVERLQGLCAIGGDVGLYARTRLRSNGKPMFAPRSGTMVIRPTPAARSFLEAWIKAGQSVHQYAVDQDTLVLALGRVPSLSLSLLGNEACALLEDKCPDPIVLHDRSPTHKGSVSRIRRIVTAMITKRKTIKVEASA